MYRASQVARRKSTLNRGFLLAKSAYACSAAVNMARNRNYAVSFQRRVSHLACTKSDQDAIVALNSLQTSFAVLEERRKQGHKMDDSAVHEMRQWISRAGHAVSRRPLAQPNKIVLKNVCTSDTGTGSSKHNSCCWHQGKRYNVRLC